MSTDAPSDIEARIIAELPKGPIRAIELSPLHEQLIGHLLEEAAVEIDASVFGRCLCLVCRPGSITSQAWRIRSRREANQ